jgi:excisionase family DNA binding protein
MTEEKLLTVREVSIMLGISERQVIDLAESGRLPAYKVGGVYLRFKKEQVLEFKKSSEPVSHKSAVNRGYSTKDKISDFLYFNDFYILAILVISLLLIIILRGY